MAVGTAYSTGSRVWYTLDAGRVTELYYPTIDTPQIRDLQLLFTDGETFFHDERRSFIGEVLQLGNYRILLAGGYLARDRRGRSIVRQNREPQRIGFDARCVQWASMGPVALWQDLERLWC